MLKAIETQTRDPQWVLCPSDAAIARMRRALAQFEVTGQQVRTTMPFLRRDTR